MTYKATFSPLNGYEKSDDGSKKNNIKSKERISDIQNTKRLLLYYRLDVVCKIKRFLYWKPFLLH